MPERVLIPLETLSKITGVSHSGLYLYLSHFSLYKYVKKTYKYTKNKRYRRYSYLLNEESIEALKNYLQKKSICGNGKKSIKVDCIEKLKKYYKRKASKQRLNEQKEFV